jgi:hypothetical protein
MKLLKRLTIILSVLLLLESCASTRRLDSFQNREQKKLEISKQKYTKREKRDRLFLLVVLIPTIIWILTPKPLNQ